jgi:TP901 family phage tail tape measure protein
MGFAGQVFAARVAIGLAFPSKQAMGQASQIIGAGAAALHKKMNSSSVKAATARKQHLEKELTKLEALTAKHSASLDGKLSKQRQKFVNSVGRMNIGAKVSASKTKSEFIKTQKSLGSAKTDKQLANTFKAGDVAFMEFAKHVKARSPDLMIKIFGTGDLDEVHEARMDFGKLADVLHEVGEEGDKNRRELQNVARLEVENARRRKTVGLEEIKLMRTKTEWLKKTGQISGDEYQNAIELLDDETQGYKDALQAAEGHYTFINEGIRSYEETYNDWDNKRKKMEKDELSIKKLIQQAIKGEADAMKLLEQGMARAARKASEFAESLKTNFQNALRESISALTAMFYKLQQNTQELVEFERELMNANSVFNLTRDELFKTSETITQFGQSFGLEMQNGAEGLYQLASAGLSADQATQVLPETLKLSMAVQGDHNTIAKLTTQTLMGFSMEMNQAAEVTDKFAHVIQKSLIEYEDLTSAVKFAMPFFTATGQSVDQLLGALTVLTNRALEAGIAGRGLRQALAEFAEHADNNEAAFSRMGLEIKKADGSMKDLTVIAKEYSDIIGPDAASNTELLTSLIEDLNVRGATAFVHLVQNADEFALAVENVENAGGELDEMVRIQNESMASQIQILKNNIQMLFFYNDGVERANGAMNGFHSAIIDGITGFQDLLVTGEEGNKQLTEFGKTIQDVAVEAVHALTELLQDAIKFLAGFSGQGKTALGILKAYLLPIKILMKAIDFMGPRVTSLVVQFAMLNKLFSLTAGLRATVAGFVSLYKYLTGATVATTAETVAVEGSIAAKTTEIGVNRALSASELELAGSRTASASAATGGAGAEILYSQKGMAKAGSHADTLKDLTPGQRSVHLADMGYTGALTKSGMPDKRTAKGKEWSKFLDKGGHKKNIDIRKQGGYGMRSGSYTMPPGMKSKNTAAAIPKSAAKVGLMTRAMQGLVAIGTGAIAVMAAVAAAIAAIGVVGLNVMGSLEPTIQIIKGWGESLKWAFAWVGMKFVQLAQSLGILGPAMEDAKVTTANALEEMKWAFLRWGMGISMSLGVLVGGLVFMLDKMFKGMHAVVMDAIGNSYLTDAIIGGFSNIWNKLFDAETGWLRWLTWTWWSTTLGELKTSITGYDWGSLIPDLTPSSFAIPEFLTYDYWFGDDGLWSNLKAGFELFKLDPIGTMVDMAKISMNAFIGVYNAFAETINSIEFEFNTGGWEAKTMPMWSYSKGWYDQPIIGAFDGVGFGVNMAGALPMKDLIALQTGGYVMRQTGGPINNRQPYLVGERGPELFMPNQSGQVINNSRTQSILRNSMNGGNLRPSQGSGEVLYVDRLEVRESQMNKSKIAVDTFAGVV